MLTPQDVRSVQFEKNLRGYRTEDALQMRSDMARRA